MGNLICYAVRNRCKNIVRYSCPIGCHKIICCYCTNCHKVIICSMVTHYTNGINTRQNTEKLCKIFFIAVLCHFVTEHPVSILKHLDFLCCNFTDYTNTKSRTRERLTPDKLFRNTELFADSSYLVLKQIGKRLNDAQEFHILRRIHSVMVCFNNIGITLARFNTIRIDCTLCEKAKLILLSDFIPEHIEKFCTDYLSFFLRVSNTF